MAQTLLLYSFIKANAHQDGIAKFGLRNNGALHGVDNQVGIAGQSLSCDWIKNL
jgi:hypothetical protein